MMDPAVAKLIERAAAEVHNLYRKWVEHDDVFQTMWLWAMEHPIQVEGMPPVTLRRRLKDAGIAYCKREKAHKSGYHPDDEYRYSQATILRLLPDAFDPEATRPVSGVDTGGAAKGEHSSMEWETQVVDVRVGLDRLGYADYKVLEQVASGGRAANDLLAQDALRRLQRKINS